MVLWMTLLSAGSTPCAIWPAAVEEAGTVYGHASGCPLVALVCPYRTIIIISAHKFGVHVCMSSPFPTADHFLGHALPSPRPAVQEDIPTSAVKPPRTASRWRMIYTMTFSGDISISPDRWFHNLVPYFATLSKLKLSSAQRCTCARDVD